MPKYYRHKVYGYYLYFTTFCLVEALHVHASDEQLTEDLSAKFFVKADGSTVLAKRGKLTDREIAGVNVHICLHKDKVPDLANRDPVPLWLNLAAGWKYYRKISFGLQ